MKNYRLGIILTLLVAAVVVSGGIYLYTGKDVPGEKNSGKKKEKKKDKNQDQDVSQLACFGGSLEVQQTWEMPNELLEISGIAWLGNDKIAAVQDNAGTVYIYNLKSEKVEQKINFGEKGDYEGLAYTNGNFFVMRADGLMMEINQKGDVLKEYKLPLSVTDNIESFHFDAANNRMLIGQKDGEKGASKKYIYSFDMASRKFNKQPTYTINLSDPVVSCNINDTKTGETAKKEKGKKEKGKKANIRPSEMAINPETKEIFIADGPNQRILVLSPDAKPLHYLSLDSKAFPQVEGLLFTPQGELYISSEGIKNPANISKMKIINN